MSHILVAYATHAGSTREVAERIGQIFQEEGLQVTVQPAVKTRSLAGFTAVVLGAPLYMFRWHGDAKGFLNRHHKALSTLPAAVFGMGPMEDKPEQWQGAREQLDKELARFEWFSPVNVTLFGGRFDAALLRFPYSLIPAMKAFPPADLRDWEAIRAWTVDLAQKFQGEKTQA